jgi:hypothetical protein
VPINPGPAKANPNLSKPFQTFPRLFQEKKDCLFFYEPPQINPSVTCAGKARARVADGPDLCFIPGKDGRARRLE